MQELQVYEYAVIRIVPRVEREEFINAGVILYCAKQKFLQTHITLSGSRLCALSSAIDMEELKTYLHTFEQICAGGIHAGTIGKLDLASRFRWLTAMRSTVVQISKVHPGLCTDAAATLTRLHAQLVL